MTKVAYFLEQDLVFKEKPKNVQFQDLEGQKFGRLTVAEFAGRERGTTYWKCICDCGNVTIARAAKLKNGHTQSCGCLQRQRAKESNITHGYAGSGGKSSTYNTWAGMIARCHNPKYPSFFSYGGRGIKVCQRWLKFENFLADMGEKPNGLSLDRKDNDLGYSKGNCRWATTKTQTNNRRSNRLIEFGGKIQTLSQLSDEYGVNYKMLWMRLKRGWTIEKALIK